MGQGALCSKAKKADNFTETSDIVVYVQTGDKKEAGTDANVKIILHFDNGQKTPDLKLDNFFKNDFERGRRDKFSLKNIENHGSVAKVEFWRDDAGLGSQWFLELIEVNNKRGNETYTFPVQRWIKSNYRYVIPHLDTSLPQYDKQRDQRRMELEGKKKRYEYVQRATGMPVQLKSLPDDEEFSWDYAWNIIVKQKFYLKTARNLVRFSTGRWKKLEDIPNMFTKDPDLFPAPPTISYWNDDANFGRQRLTGVNPMSIVRCTGIPEKFDLTDDLVQPFLDGLSLQQAIQSGRLYIVDLDILKDLPHKRNMVCAPIALFFVNKEFNLMPVAIQLFQDKAPDNPVFVPTDPPYTWMLAKMWFNNADSCIHQAQSHLGFTHILMEGVSISVHRNLAPSHPVFRLLAPHFLFLLAINYRALDSLLKDDGILDSIMNFGKDGALTLMARAFAKVRLNVDCCVPEDLRNRGVDDPKCLPNYHYRDDALQLYTIIKDYVSKYTDLYYKTPTELLEDNELQSWARELVTPKDKGGCGFNGVPGDGRFETQEQLVLTLTIIVYSCSVGHAAVNFCQYDQYAFQPNYPSVLLGKPPADKRPLTETDVMAAVCDKWTALNAAITTKILSTMGTNSIGYQEVQYIFDTKALKVIKEFQEKLKGASDIIQQRNATRTPPYRYLDPEHVPNSISI